MKNFVNLNGKILKESEVSISCNNKTFRYGNGFFETMKWMDGRILLEQFHFERMFETINALSYNLSKKINSIFFVNAINELISKNEIQLLARIRITFFENEGGIFVGAEEPINFLIQTWPLNKINNEINENGLELGIFNKGYKSIDLYSKYKLNSSYPYSLAANWAKLNKLNDAVILNSNNNISDTCIANIFCLCNGIIKTPSLEEGCVDGVMRRFVIQQFEKFSIPYLITVITKNDLLEAQEIFLTNSIRGIKWVKRIDNIQFKNKETILVEKLIMKSLFHH